MSSTNRSRRNHLSSKIPNVKLRPANSRVAESSTAGTRHGKGKARDRSQSPENLMDREMVRRLYVEDEGEERDADPDLNPASFTASSSTAPLRNMIFCFTGISDRKASLTKILKQMGADVELNLTMDGDVLIADGFRSAKYLSAIQHGITVLTPEWITETHKLWLSGADLDIRKNIEEFNLKPFRDLKVAVSGIEPVSRRSEMEQLIVSLGGQYSKNLDRTCTHLIVSKNTEKSKKVDYALSLLPKLYRSRVHETEPEDYIHVVWEGWFWDCVEFRARWEEERWDLRGGKGPGVGESMKEKRDAARLKEAEASAVALTRAQEAEAAAEALVNLDVKPFDLNTTGDEVLQQAVIRKVGGGAGKDKRVGDVGGLVDDLMNSVVGGKTEGSRKRPSDERDPPDTSRLDGETIGVQDDEDTTSPSGGRKRARLALVGSQSDASKPAPQSKLHNSRIHAFATESDVQGVKSVAAPAKTSTAQRRPVNVPAGGRKIFAGLVFSHIVSEKAVNMEIALKEQGATLVKEEDRLRGQHVDYIVTRLAGGSWPIEVEGCKAQLVTECWVEACIYDQKICSVDDSIVYRPLSQAMPIPGAEKMRIHLSGFTDEMRFFTKRLITAIGANYAELLSRKLTTHLLCTKVNTVKFDKANLWEIPVLKVDWLYDVASKGSLQPFDGYQINTEEAMKVAYTPAAGTSGVEVKQVPHVNANSVVDAKSATPTASTSIQEQVDAETSVAPMAEEPQRSQGTSQASRKLGLNPTEVNLGAPLRSGSGSGSGTEGLSLPGPATERLLNSVLVESAPVKPATPPLGKTVSAPPAANPFKVPQQPVRKSVETTAQATTKSAPSVSALTAEMMQRLDQADLQEEERRARGARRPRPIARKHSGPGTRTRSILAPHDSEIPHEGAHGGNAHARGSSPPSEQGHDDADQSIRVRYNDPVAEREKKRLLDALTRPDVNKSKRSKNMG